MFATTLAEYGHAGQVTGKVVEFPNGLLLTTPVKNVSPTGEYVLHLMRVPVPAAMVCDLVSIEDTARTAAELATREWQEQAEAHFRKLANEDFISYSSGRIKVLWDFDDAEHLAVLADDHRGTRVEALEVLEHFVDLLRRRNEMRRPQDVAQLDPR